MTTHHIAVIGAGAIGQLVFHQLSAYLANKSFSAKDFTVDLYCRESQTRQLMFTDLAARQHIQTTSLLSPLNSQLRDVDVVILCVKAYQVSDVVRSVVSKLKPSCHIILLHNGMGPHRHISQLLTQCPAMGLSLATTSQGALKSSNWGVVHTGSGSTSFGHYSGELLDPILVDMLLEAIPHSHWLPDIETALWQKLVINCAINPLTAFYQCKNGVLEKAQYQNEITAIVSECTLVAAAEGVNLDSKACYLNVLKVIDMTKDNISSMWQDIRANRATEINFISGYIVDRAKQHNIPTPANSLNLQRILTISANAELPR